MQKARMESAFWLVVIGASLVQLAGVCRVPAQNTPDIVWQTNAHTGRVLAVAFSAGGQLLASGSEDRTTKVWTVPGVSLVTTVTTPSAWTMSVAVHPPGDLLLTGGDDGAVRVWSITSGTFLYGTPPSEHIVWSIVVVGDGAIAISKSNRGIDLVSQQGAFSLNDSGGDIFSLGFSSDASKLASAGRDGTAKIWRVSDGTLLQVFTGHSTLSTNEDDVIIRTVYSVDFSPDGTLVASAGADDAVRLWRVNDGTEIRVITSPNCGVVKFSADGKLLFTVNNGLISVWRVATGQLLCTYANAQAGPLAVASNGKFFAYGRGDGTVVLARVPLWIESIAHADGEMTLRWQGGSGRYQVQRRKGLSDGPWRAVGRPTTNTSATLKAPTRKNWFYRVQSLPNP